MPKKDIILNLPGYSIVNVTGKNPVYIQVNYNQVVRCIYCNGKRLRKKDSFERKIRHESIGLRYSYLCINVYKFQCYECKRYFNQRFPGIGRYQRATESLRKEVFHHHTQGVSQKDLSRHFHTGKSTIEQGQTNQTNDTPNPTQKKVRIPIVESPSFHMPDRGASEGGAVELEPTYDNNKAYKSDRNPGK